VNPAIRSGRIATANAAKQSGPQLSAATLKRLDGLAVFEMTTIRDLLHPFLEHDPEKWKNRFSDKIMLNRKGKARV
jgi:hypothetical protein